MDASTAGRSRPHRLEVKTEPPEGRPMKLRFAPYARCLVLAGALAVAGPAAAQAPFTPEQRQAIGDVVRDYLLKNPEVLQEVMTELERRQQETQRAAQTAALGQSREALLNGANDFAAGNPSGDLTLVEFFDYNCGYCKRALTDLQALIKGDPKIRVVLKDFPVLGPDSVEASRAALAVKRQLNGAKLQKDMESPAVKATIQENVVLGDKLGLSGTPAFVVGDEIISGAVGLELMRKTVAGVRQCGRAVC